MDRKEKTGLEGYPGGVCGASRPADGMSNFIGLLVPAEARASHPTTTSLTKRKEKKRDMKRVSGCKIGACSPRGPPQHIDRTVRDV